MIGEDTMSNMQTLLRRAAAALGLLVLAFAASASAADVLDDWAAAKAPPPPELKPVKLEASTTALLIMDLMKNGVCADRPRCVATIPNVKRLFDAAHAAGAMVWFALGGPNGKPADVIDIGYVPRDGEWEAPDSVDKFFGSHLDEKLKARGIKTVILCGTSFQGVGVSNALAAADRGYKVIVPVDCLSSQDAYGEQSAVTYMFNDGPAVVRMQVTLTRSAMVKF
jgi:nicotinamidase-related amidase